MPIVDRRMRRCELVLPIIFAHIWLVIVQASCEVEFGNIAIVFYSAERVSFVQYGSCLFLHTTAGLVISALRKYLRFFDVSFAVISHLRCDAWTAHEFFLFFCFECNDASFCTSIHWFPLVLYVTLLSSIWIQSYQCAMHLALSSQVVSSLLESILIILIYRFLCCLFRGYK